MVPILPSGTLCLFPPCGFPSGLWPLVACSIIDEVGETEAEKTLGRNPQRTDSAKYASPIPLTTELNANNPKWYLGRCRI